MPTFLQIEQAEMLEREFRLWVQQERPSEAEQAAVQGFLQWRIT